MKKLLSLLLCITMLAVLVVPVMAATEPEETVWEEESDTIYFEVVTVDPESFTYEGWETNPDGSIQWKLTEDGEKPSEDAVIQWYPYTDGAIVSEDAIVGVPDMIYQDTLLAPVQTARQFSVLGILILILLGLIVIILLGGGLVLGVGIVIVAIALIAKAIGKKKTKKEETICEEA